MKEWDGTYSGTQKSCIRCGFVTFMRNIPEKHEAAENGRSLLVVPICRIGW